VIEVAFDASLCAYAGGSSGVNALSKALSLPPARFTKSLDSARSCRSLNGDSL
jgi:hypothetical protein